MATTPTTTDNQREYTVQVSGEMQVEELRKELSKIDEDQVITFFQLGFETTGQTPVNILPETIQEETVTESKSDGSDSNATTSESTETGSEVDEGKSDGSVSEGVEIDSDGTVSDDPSAEELDSDRLEEYEYQTLQKAASGAGIKGNQKKEVLVEGLREYLTDTEETNTSEDGSLSLRPGHDPYYVLLILRKASGWIRTAEIRDAVRDEWDVNKDTIGNTLWHLSQRDLVETQPYEDDKRQKQYQLTDEGMHVVMKAIEYEKQEGDPPNSPNL